MCKKVTLGKVDNTGRFNRNAAEDFCNSSAKAAFLLKHPDKYNDI